MVGKSVKSRSGKIFGKIKENEEVWLQKPRRRSRTVLHSRKSTNVCFYCHEKIPVGEPMFMTTKVIHQHCYFKKYYEDEVTRKYRERLREYKTLMKMSDEEKRKNLVGMWDDKPVLKETSRHIVLSEEREE